MGDDQNGRQPKWKMTKRKTTIIEDDIMEDNQNERQPKWKKT